MKMEMPVEAPQAGRVAKVEVTEGQAVEEGDVLVRLE
jgi:biotin carboxyl carrier protein